MASSLDPQIKANLIRFRNNCKLTQTDLADLVGISRNTYRSIEVGETGLVHKALDKIAKRLGVSVESLILGYNPLDINSDPRLAKFKKDISLQQKKEREMDHKEMDRLLAENYELKEKVAMQKQIIEAKDQLIEYLKNQKG